jgi:hypothetical protein
MIIKQLVLFCSYLFQIKSGDIIATLEISDKSEKFELIFEGIDEYGSTFILRGFHNQLHFLFEILNTILLLIDSSNLKILVGLHINRIQEYQVKQAYFDCTVSFVSRVDDLIFEHSLNKFNSLDIFFHFLQGISHINLCRAYLPFFLEIIQRFLASIPYQ